MAQWKYYVIKYAINYGKLFIETSSQVKKVLICFKSKLVFYFTRGISLFVKTSTNFFVIPFLGMTPEYEREKQPSRGVLQTGVTM